MNHSDSIAHKHSSSLTEERGKAHHSRSYRTDEKGRKSHDRKDHSSTSRREHSQHGTSRQSTYAKERERNFAYKSRKSSHKKHRHSHKKRRRRSRSTSTTTTKSSTSTASVSATDDDSSASKQANDLASLKKQADVMGIPKQLFSLSLDELEKLREDRRQKKNMLKIMETPEEKRARRLAKKEAKERWRRERMGWDKEYIGYTNDDNPFGDHRLSESFIWKRKLELQGLAHLPKDEVQMLQKKKMEENKVELKSVRRRRMERERDREEREKEMEMMQREKEAEYYRTWGQQEDQFHLEQAKLRSRIRIADGRAKPIDLLSRYISEQEEELTEMSLEDISSAVDILEPTQFLVGLSIEDLEDLIEDIKVVYMQLEQGRNADYWRDITIVVEDELYKLRRMERTGDLSSRCGADSRGRSSASISQSVMQSVAETLKGKTFNQLAALEKQIEPKLHGGEGVDVTYWETLAQFVKAQMARTRLRDMHQENLRRKLEYLRQSQGILPTTLFPSGADSVQEPATSEAAAEEDETKEKPGANVELDDEIMHVEDPHSMDAVRAARIAQLEAASLMKEEQYDPRVYSPPRVDPAELELDTVIYNPEDDFAKIEYQRTEIVKTGAMRASEEEELMRRAREGMEDGEDAQFSVTIPVEDQSFLWSDKYRPRKPRFFNRVHTGFVWNKYNQTHYDLDNPPPKIVQGYKFNVFYADLIDKTKTPSYTLTPCDGPTEKDFAILRFTAGPPYEDIAFKIVNREWEYSYKHGFRCQFQNNIFQLWFHFKRFRYRR